MITLHGGVGLDSTYLRKSLQPLENQFDVRHYDRHKIEPQAEDFDGWVEQLENVRSKEFGDEKIILFGHSFGGFLALEYALKHQDKLKGLILCTTGPKIRLVRNMAMPVLSEKQTQAMKRFGAEGVTSSNDVKEAWDAALPVFLSNPSVTQKNILDGTRFSVEGLLKEHKAVQQWSVEDRLGEITIPTLVIAGKHDWTFGPDDAKAMAAKLPNATTVVLDTGHFPFWEDPTGFKKAIEEYSKNFSKRQS